jgi:hypothetical protein
MLTISQTQVVPEEEYGCSGKAPYTPEEAGRDFEEAVEGIRRGLAAAQAGDETPFEEYVAARREKRRRLGKE